MTSNSFVELDLLLEGGQTQTLTVSADAPELIRLFQILGRRGSALAEEQFFQLPLKDGKEAFSFSSAQLVAIRSRPPILEEFHNIQPDNAGQNELVNEAVAASHEYQKSQYQIIDNFLGHYEHLDMLAYAAEHEEELKAATINNGNQSARTNMVIMDFAAAAHSTLVRNRLLIWMPQLWRLFNMEPFPVSQVESQLTVSGDGHYYRAHVDSDSAASLDRVLTCIYYFSRQPQQFSGGGLRIYDSLVGGDERRQAETFTQIEPIANRMVVFPSDCFHELLPIRCPSRAFLDSRFAITNWIWRSREPQPRANHGWGHLRCGRVPEDWWHSRDSNG